MLRLCSLLLPLLVLFAACGIDETYTGMGEGALPGDPLHPSTNEACNTDCPACECNCTGGGPADDVAVGDAGSIDVEDLTGTAWRIEEMIFTAPLTGLFGDELNGVIADEIAAGNINVILHVTEDDRESKTLGLAVGAAHRDIVLGIIHALVVEQALGTVAVSATELGIDVDFGRSH